MRRRWRLYDAYAGTSFVPLLQDPSFRPDTVTDMLDEHEDGIEDVAWTATSVSGSSPTTPCSCSIILQPSSGTPSLTGTVVSEDVLRAEDTPRWSLLREMFKAPSWAPAVGTRLSPQSAAREEFKGQVPRDPMPPLPSVFHERLSTSAAPTPFWRVPFRVPGRLLLPLSRGTTYDV